MGLRQSASSSTMRMVAIRGLPFPKGLWASGGASCNARRDGAEYIEGRLGGNQFSFNRSKIPKGYSVRQVAGPDSRAFGAKARQGGTTLRHLPRGCAPSRRGPKLEIGDIF